TQSIATGCIRALYHRAVSRADFPLPVKTFAVNYVYAEQPRIVPLAKPGRGFRGWSGVRSGHEAHAGRRPPVDPARRGASAPGRRPLVGTGGADRAESEAHGAYGTRSSSGFRGRIGIGRGSEGSGDDH